MITHEERFLRLKHVVEKTGLSKSEIYRRIAVHAFPRQARLSHRVSVWRLSDIEHWMLCSLESACWHRGPQDVNLSVCRARY